MVTVNSLDNGVRERILYREGAKATACINISVEADGVHLHMIAVDGSLVTGPILTKDMVEKLVFTLNWSIGKAKYIPILESPSEGDEQ